MRGSKNSYSGGWEGAAPCIHLAFVFSLQTGRHLATWQSGVWGRRPRSTLTVRGIFGKLLLPPAPLCPLLYDGVQRAWTIKKIK